MQTISIPSTALPHASIGIFDSGFGGLTIMRAMMQVLPKENMIYFGDTARLPYGNKSAETVLRYSVENTSFLIEQGIKLLVVACNTACTAALEHLQKKCSIPVIGMIQAGVEQVLQSSKQGKIAILGTRATIQSGVYQQQIQLVLPNAQITAISCPLFVPLVEEGYIDHPLTQASIQEYLGPLRRKEVDTVLLGCTHYPLLASMIQKELGPQVSLIDPAIGCAEKVRLLLEKLELHNQGENRPQYEFYVSDDPEKFRLLGKTFLNHPIEHVQSKKL